MSVTKQYADSKFQVIKLCDMSFEFEPSCPMTTFKVFLPDGTMIRSNFCEDRNRLKGVPGFHYFLIDSEDLANMERVWYECKTLKEKDEKTEEYLGTITKFSGHFSKRIYVRLIPPSILGSDEEPRVFADEVFEVIPIVLAQQKTPLAGSDDQQLENRRRNCFGTLTVSELESTLEELDIDKSLITLIPDPSYEMTRREYIQRSTHIRMFAHNSKVVSDVYQTMNRVFSFVVMGVNWKYDKCMEHEGCNERMKTLIMSCFKMLQGMEGSLMNCDTSKKFIEKIRSECVTTHNVPRTVPDFLLQEFQVDEDSPIDYYHRVVDHFDLPKYPAFIPGTKEGHLPVWEHRVLCKLGWIQQFFDKPDDQEVKNAMIECLYFMVPDEHVKATKEFVTSTLNRSVRAIEVASDPWTEDHAVKMLTAQLKRNVMIQKRKKEAKQKKRGSK